MVPACTLGTLDDLRELQRKEGRSIGTILYRDDEERSGPDYGDYECKDALVSGFAPGVGAASRAEAVDLAVASHTLLADKSHWGIIRVRGEDRLRFLHNHGTNAFEGCTKGEVVSTCFTSNQGRVIDFVEAVVLGGEVRVLCAPNRWSRLLARMEKFMFPLDRTTVSSMSGETAIFFVAGPEVVETLAKAGCRDLPEPGRATKWDFQEQKVVVMAHSRPMARGPGSAKAPPESSPSILEGGVSSAGTVEGTDREYTLLVPSVAAAPLWSTLSAQPSVLVAGEQEWQMLRIKRGLPFPGQELTVQYTPLEAGLWHAVHFDKGCYVGQETISRVNTYKNAKAGLYGIEFEEGEEGGDGGRVSEGDVLLAEGTGERAGVVTSLLDPDVSARRQGLAYIRSPVGGVGLKVLTKASGARGIVCDVPYPTRSEAESAHPPSAEKQAASGEQDAATMLRLEDEKAKEKARKEAKVAALAKKLEALKARRQGK